MLYSVKTWPSCRRSRAVSELLAQQHWLRSLHLPPDTGRWVVGTVLSTSHPFFPFSSPLPHPMCYETCLSGAQPKGMSCAESAMNIPRKLPWTWLLQASVSNLWNGDEKPLAAWTHYRSMWEAVLGSPSRTHSVDRASWFLSVLSSQSLQQEHGWEGLGFTALLSLNFPALLPWALICGSLPWRPETGDIPWSVE